MKFVLRAAIVSLVCMPAIATAGWNSGGGKLLKYSNNPWFLENTSRVTYCVKASDKHFDVEQGRLESLVGEVFGSWKRAFDYASDDVYDPGDLWPYDQVRVGTQEFLRTTCTKDVDIRFQFGFLSKKQRETYFDDPREFVGAAVRTEYDLRNLKSRGFIYIAPMSGPLKPDLRDIHPTPWTEKDNAVLKAMLLHEIGHIFGMPHSGKGIMDESLPEKLVLSYMVEHIEHFMSYYDPIDIFRSRKSFEQAGCDNESPLSEPDVFGLSDKTRCSRVEFETGDGYKSEFRLFAGESESSLVKVGRAKFNGVSRSSIPAVTVYLPKEQIIFRQSPSLGGAYLRGEKIELSSSFDGVLESEIGAHNLPIKLDFVPWQNFGDQHVTVFSNGRFRVDPLWLN